MKKGILIVLSCFFVINVFFPNTFMGRIYINDFEKHCFESHYYDVVTYETFKNGAICDWEQNDNIECFKTELEGKVIRVLTSYDHDCYFYEDVENDGVLWCTVDGYAKGSILVGDYYKEYGSLTLEESDAQREAIKTFNSQVDKMNRKTIDKMKFRRNIMVCLVAVVWILYFACSIVAKKSKEKYDRQLEDDFDTAKNKTNEEI